MMDGRAPTAARITGDDLQFLIAWYWCLAARRRDDILDIRIEAPDAGNVDDVVVRQATGPDIYIQVKATVTGREPLTTSLLLEKSAAGGRSVLRRFFDFWQQNRHKRIQLQLVTNRSLAANDPLLKERDSAAKLADAVRRRTRSPELAATIASVSNELGCDEQTLVAFLDDLVLHTDATETAWIDKVRDIAAPDVRCDQNGISIGVGRIREWVKRERPTLAKAQIEAAIDDLGLRLGSPKTVIAVSALDLVGADDAFASLDFVERFRGTTAGERRGLKESVDWDGFLRSEIEHVADSCKAAGRHDVLIRATCRLPLWFRIGRSFSEAAGFVVSTTVRQETWDSSTPYGEVPLRVKWHQPPKGAEAAIMVSLVADHPITDVRSYVSQELGDIGLVDIRRPSAPAQLLSVEGSSYALGVRNDVRNIVREAGLTKLHVFIVTPAPVALLLGHLWDRMPPTQLYEDLGRPASYEPAFLIR